MRSIETRKDITSEWNRVEVKEGIRICNMKSFEDFAELFNIGVADVDD